MRLSLLLAVMFVLSACGRKKQLDYRAVAARVNPLILQLRSAAAIVADPSTDPAMVVDACQRADTPRMLVAITKLPERDLELQRELYDRGTRIDFDYPIKCVPIEEKLSRCVRWCREAWKAFDEVVLELSHRASREGVHVELLSDR